MSNQDTLVQLTDRQSALILCALRQLQEDKKVYEEKGTAMYWLEVCEDPSPPYFEEFEKLCEWVNFAPFVRDVGKNRDKDTCDECDTNLDAESEGGSIGCPDGAQICRRCFNAGLH